MDGVFAVQIRPGLQVADEKSGKKNAAVVVAALWEGERTSYYN
jgi:hypothetical protein